MKLRHGAVARLASGNEIVELIQEFIGTKLIWIGDLEIRIQRVEVVAEFNLRSGHS